jgi:hypothetical protein
VQALAAGLVVRLVDDVPVLAGLVGERGLAVELVELLDGFEFVVVFGEQFLVEGVPVQVEAVEALPDEEERATRLQAGFSFGVVPVALPSMASAVFNVFFVTRSSQKTRSNRPPRKS